MKLDDLARQAAADVKNKLPPAPPLRPPSATKGGWLPAALASAGGVLLIVAIVVLVRDLPDEPLATATSTTVTATPSTADASIPGSDEGVAGQRWIRATYGTGVTGSDGELVADVPLALSGRSLAWDGGDGFVYMTDAGDLHWWSPRQDKLLMHIELVGGETSLIDVATGDSMFVVVKADDGIAIFPADTAFPAPELLYEWLDYGRIKMLASGRWAYIDQPDWSTIPRREGGELIPPFPLRQLVITDHDRQELIRFDVGSFDQPYAILHAFDGRRVIVSIEPHEPALAPRTVFIVDLECPTCTEVVYTFGPDTFDLVGVLPWSAPPMTPDLTFERDN